MRIIIEDCLTESLLREITEAENQSEGRLRKKKCVEYITKYEKQFGIEWLGQILVDSFYESKSSKRDKSLQKKILNHMDQLLEYLEKYISEQEIGLKDMRTIRDLL